jgi:hypothetical protein
METRPAPAQNLPIILSCDGDPTLREGDWLRLWNSTGGGIAHDVWVGVGGIVYENSGPGGFVRRNTFANVLVGRQVITIMARTATVGELREKVNFAESKLETPWAGFYNCQDFASEVATGSPQSFQRDGLVVATLLVAGLAFYGSQQPPGRGGGHAAKQNAIWTIRRNTVGKWQLRQRRVAHSYVRADAPVRAAISAARHVPAS